MIFLDTSVLVAVAQVQHVHHAPSRDLWNFCSAPKTAINAHTLVEMYSALTSMPVGLRVSPRNAVAAIEIFLQRLSPVSLTLQEYQSTIRDAARWGITGGSIYDALHAACARKVNAERIYTWNIRHFERVAPDLKGRIVTPEQA